MMWKFDIKIISLHVWQEHWKGEGDEEEGEWVKKGNNTELEESEGETETDWKGRRSKASDVKIKHRNYVFRHLFTAFEGWRRRRREWRDLRKWGRMGNNKKIGMKGNENGKWYESWYTKYLLQISLWRQWKHERGKREWWNWSTRPLSQKYVSR